MFLVCFNTISKSVIFDRTFNLLGSNFLSDFRLLILLFFELAVTFLTYRIIRDSG